MSKKSATPGVKRTPLEYVEQTRTWVARYRIVLFLALIGGLYGYTMFQIYSLSNQSLDTSSVDSQVTSLTPHIDQSVVRQLESLKDNSVSVKALFDKARQNPFAE